MTGPWTLDKKVVHNGCSRTLARPYGGSSQRSSWQCGPTYKKCLGASAMSHPSGPTSDHGRRPAPGEGVAPDSPALAEPGTEARRTLPLRGVHAGQWALHFWDVSLFRTPTLQLFGPGPTEPTPHVLAAHARSPRPASAAIRYGLLQALVCHLGGQNGL
jgi:hypothetical protein